MHTRLYEISHISYVALLAVLALAAVGLWDGDAFAAGSVEITVGQTDPSVPLELTLTEGEQSSVHIKVKLADAPTKIVHTTHGPLTLPSYAVVSIDTLAYSDIFPQDFDRLICKAAPSSVNPYPIMGGHILPNQLSGGCPPAPISFNDQSYNRYRNASFISGHDADANDHVIPVYVKTHGYGDGSVYTVLITILDDDKEKSKEEAYNEWRIAGYAPHGTIVIRGADDRNNRPTFSSVVTDNTAPVITIRGQNPKIIDVGDSYNDAGATCADRANNGLTPDPKPKIYLPTNTIDTSAPGEYYLRYGCTDASGNSAEESRTVTVRGGQNSFVAPADIIPPSDTNPPTITLNGQKSITITAGTTYTDAGARCIDDTDPRPTLSIGSSVDTSTPGTYTITYDCRDSSDNPAIQKSRTVKVQAPPDETPPTITLNGQKSITITAGTTYTDAGARCIDDTDSTPTLTVNNPVDPPSITQALIL